MTENELRYLLTIAEYGNITKAAQELFISQPSLSESLSKVEQEFGRPIFHRDRNGLTPTDFGQKYLDTAGKILELYRQMNLDLDEYRQMRRGTLNFGIPFNLGAYVLPRILPQFCQIYPEITVHFKENNSTELDKLMLSGKLDFSIMHYETPDPTITYEPLADDPFYLVMPIAMTQKYYFPDYRELSIYDLRSLADEPFLMIASRQKLRQIIDAILNGDINNVPTKKIPYFDFEVPTELNGVDTGILDPRDTYADASEWETKAKDLAARFIKNFSKYEGNAAGKALVSAGPQL